MIQTKGSEKLPCHIDDFSVEGRVVVTNSLAAELVVLPVSPCLWSIISKDGSQIIELYWLREIAHTVFHVSTAHWGSALWPQRQVVASLVIKGVHFFIYNIGSFSHTAAKKGGIFKYRAVNTLVAIELTGIDHFLLYVAPVGLLLG